MIKKLKTRFALYCALAVVSIVMLILCFFGSSLSLITRKTIDRYLDTISSNGGILPDHFSRPSIDFVGEENSDSLRYFTVVVDQNNNPVAFNLNYISSITVDEAVIFTNKALSKNFERGWIHNYRYKITSFNEDTAVIFFDANIIRGTINVSFSAIALLLLFFGALVFFVLTVLSKRLFKPIVESYNKQKQFITDVSHDLKTPITLINTNIEIIEAEIGKNEWLDDVKKESLHMTEMVNELVSLTKMSETLSKMQVANFKIDEVLTEAVSEFKILSNSKGKNLSSDIEKSVDYVGDISTIRRLFGILLDNAIKYCDKDGDIVVKLVKQHRHPVITISNTYSQVDEVELDKLFDRFYRADKSRTHRESFGIGLSVAKNIAIAHHGDIICYKKDKNVIEFKVVLK